MGAKTNKRKASHAQNRRAHVEADLHQRQRHLLTNTLALLMVQVLAATGAGCRPTLMHGSNNLYAFTALSQKSMYCAQSYAVMSCPPVRM